MADLATLSPDVDVVVMAKAGIPGKVKTRLIGVLGPGGATAVHEAMMACVLERVGRHVPGRRVLALAGAGAEASRRSAWPSGWRIIDQGTGDLGQRMDHVWRRLGCGAIVFLGADSPDLPAGALAAIVPALGAADAAIGPVSDGGYWTLAARRYVPQLLRGIDWGGASVYDQTMATAARVRVSVTTLDAWHDVDRPGDLAALRRRLESPSPQSPDPALLRLRDGLRRACEDPT